MQRKIIYLIVLTLLITTTVTPLISQANNNKDNNFIKNINPEINNLPKCIEGKKIQLEKQPLYKPANIPVISTEDEELHPTFSMGSSGELFGAYALQSSLFESNIYYFYSGDNGENWEELGGYTLEGFYDFPAVDYWGSESTFVATFSPDPGEYQGAAQFRIIFRDPLDPETWDATYWDWTSFDQRDRESPDIAGYDNNGEAPEWFYGVIVDTQSSDNAEYIGEHCPVFNWADYNDENSGWFWVWTSFTNSAHACVDIDRSNGYVYGAWDWYNETTPEKGRDIITCRADLHDWFVESWLINWTLLGENEENTYPDIAAENGYVYIVYQMSENEGGNQDVYCLYSHDDGINWEISMISADPSFDELYPSIMTTGIGANCVFTKNGDLYISSTEDGGITWSTPEKMNDEPGSVFTEYRNSKVTNVGKTLWTDIRNGNKDIYYGSGTISPLITIKSVSKGFGVNAIIENIGSGDATGVACEITIDAPLMILGKETTMTVDVAVGEEVEIKTGLIFGLGPATITVKADTATETISGTVIGPFII